MGAAAVCLVSETESNIKLLARSPSRFRFMSIDRVATALELSRLIELIALSQNRQAFATLFDSAAPRVKMFLIRSGATPEAAEEIAQETLLTVWRKAGQFDASRASAMTWMFTIARNLRIDWFRKSGRLDLIELGTWDEIDPSPTPEENADATSRGKQVQTALSLLSAEQQEIIRLSFFRDKSHSQIAEELGLPLGTAKSRIRAALSKLRQILENAS